MKPVISPPQVAIIAIGKVQVIYLYSLFLRLKGSVKCFFIVRRFRGLMNKTMLSSRK